MKKIRYVALILTAVMMVVLGIYALLFDWVVPKTANFSLPRKWQMIPLGQKKAIVRDYFGEPSDLRQENDSQTDCWFNGSKGKMYQLHIYYNSDTLAESYSIQYDYKNSLVSKHYLIDSFSLK